jgi:DNA-binding MarR family transcriptional regulator
MGNKKEALINEILAGIRKLRRVVYHDYIKTSRQFGLTETQSDVLRTLLVFGAMSSADLSRNLYMTPANITGVIDRLEKKGLAERIRQQADRRVALITLTKSGKDLSERLPDPIETRLITGLAHFEEESVKNLGNAIKIILKLIDADEIPDMVAEIPMEKVRNAEEGPLAPG